MGARRGGGNKYGAHRTEYDGVTYPSAAEAAYAVLLDARMRAGQVFTWCRPKPIVLVDAPGAADRVTYRPDFLVAFGDAGPFEYIEVKGKETTDWRLRLKLYQAFGPPIPLRVVYGDGRGVVVTSRKDAA